LFKIKHDKVKDGVSKMFTKRICLLITCSVVLACLQIVFPVSAAFGAELTDDEVFSLKEVNNSRTIFWSNSEGGFFPYCNTFSNFKELSVGGIDFANVLNIGSLLPDWVPPSVDGYPLSMQPVTISSDINYLPPTLSVGEEARYFPGCVPIKKRAASNRPQDGFIID
jgi:hypothetical protein